LRLKPDYADAENDLGIALAQIDRLQEAVAHFEAALRLRPDYGDAHNNLGVILRALGRTREADTHFAEAARLGVRR
jgi:Flp pilus assembly protein TadD